MPPTSSDCRHRKGEKNRTTARDGHLSIITVMHNATFVSRTVPNNPCCYWAFWSNSNHNKHLQGSHLGSFWIPFLGYKSGPIDRIWSLFIRMYDP